MKRYTLRKVAKWPFNCDICLQDFPVNSRIVVGSLDKVACSAHEAELEDVLAQHYEKARQRMISSKGLRV